MANTSKKLKILLGLFFKAIIGTVAICFLFLLCALFFSRPFETKKIVPNQQEVQELKRLKDQSRDPDKPLRIQVKVDYSQGKKASWFPKEEAPVLKSLVDKGILPPVSMRVGEEPLVLRGIAGEGKYGGTMYKLKDLGGVRMQPTELLRWSPQGYPIVPNIAKSYMISKDNKTFTFKLRKGMKWSDGNPFTSADIIYWWKDEMMNQTLTPRGPPAEFVHRGKPAKVEAPDKYTVRFTFCAPYSLFLERLACYPWMCQSPKHYLEKFHPVIGDQELIKKVMEAHNLINSKAVYSFVKRRIELPSLAPWTMRTETATSPSTYIRNPYYWAVDEQGRQLPYTDRIVVNDKSMDMLTISAAQGEVTMQARYIRTKDYTMLMNQRQQYGYQVRQWVNGDGADWGMAFNLNRRCPKGNIEIEQKAKLLSDKKFRQALSLAVNRQRIIDALLSGEGEVCQIKLPKTSPLYLDNMEDKYASFNPGKANQLLNACGLTGRDADGYRCFPNGPTILFEINYCSFTGEGPGEFIVDDWRKVGIKATMRAQERSIFYVEKAAGLHDMTVWGGYGQYLPLLNPRYFLPYSQESNFATKNGIWYNTGGMYAKDQSKIRGVKPAENGPLLQAMKLYEQIKMASSFKEKRRLFGKIYKLAMDNVYILSFYTPPPVLGIVKDGYKNVPLKGIYSWDFLSPSNLGIETWYWENRKVDQENIAKEKRDIERELARLKPLEPLLSGGNLSETHPKGKTSVNSHWHLSKIIGGIIKWGILIAVILLVVSVVVRTPYVAKRLLIMIPTLFIISIISFIVIDIPPGDAISSKIMLMQEQGGIVDQKEINDIKAMFRTDQPAWKRYSWWMGLDWFVTFNSKDQGLLQGNMGRSMIDLTPVNEKVGDRLLFTFLISLCTILFTWAIALPIGIYSAVKQYSIFDYIFTIGGFLGMCIPGFLLALLLMYGAEAIFGLKVSGLLSAEYSAQSGWSMGKIIDLLKHLWLPILVQGVTGTAGMIRVMRANLLDELKKPYVVTAKAKGVRPLKLLFKYPVRVALNPFVSGIGGIFPQLISGGAIVAIVMSLPTIGPMQLEAVMSQDMYLAGSMLMVLSMLSVLGTLISDLLLVALDPRIRFKGGTK